MLVFQAGDMGSTPVRGILIRPGVVTEACRSDKAAAVVQLHPGLLKQTQTETKMQSMSQPTKRICPTRFWGRGVTAALRTFNPAGVGSSPSEPTRCTCEVEAACHPARCGSAGSSPAWCSRSLTIRSLQRCAHDVAAACCLAMAEVRVQLPLGACGRE